MSEKSIHPDDVQLDEEESSISFTRYWTDDRLKEAKLLAKKLVNTNFDAVEEGELRAEQEPESVVVVKPVYDREPHVEGLPKPKLPRVRIDLGWDKCEVFRVYDNTNVPEK